MKRPKQKPPQSSIGGKIINPQAFDVPDEQRSTDHMNPVFSFMDTCHNHFQLDELTRQELKQLIDQLRMFSKMTWGEVRKVKGFQPVNPSTFSKSLPTHLSPDIKIFECRVTGKIRLFGHRIRNAYHIIWFDRNHEVYPMS